MKPVSCGIDSAELHRRLDAWIESLCKEPYMAEGDAASISFTAFSSDAWDDVEDCPLLSISIETSRTDYIV